MRHHPAACGLVATLLTVVVPGLAAASGGAGQGTLRDEFLEREGGLRVEGRLVFDAGIGFGFVPADDKEKRPLPLEPGTTVRLQSSEPPASSLPPLFQVRVGESARISGQLRAVRERAVTLAVPWQSAAVSVARPGVQALLQRPGEARVFVEEFELIDAGRWSVTGKPEPFAGSEGGVRRGVKLPAGEASLVRRLDEPLLAGRLEFSFRDEARVVAGRRWKLELTFRGPGGPATVRVVLGWDEESLAVESPDGPSLSVQRLARTAGPHRLAVRFGPEQIELSVDGKELAYGKGPAGPLETIRIATSSTAAGDPPEGLAGVVGEVQLVRFAEVPASLEIDPSQDEARLVVGDQLYGTIRKGDPERVAIDVDERPVSLDWGEVAGLFFRREPAAGAVIEGPQARVEWRASPGNSPRDVDFAEGAVIALTDSAITLSTSFSGTLSIPRDRLTRLRILEPGRLQVLDPAAHHLGDNISASSPLLDPPLPEGGVLERTFEVKDIGAMRSWLVLDVVQVVGETAGTPYSNLVQRGELRTNLSINGKPIDYLNRHITTSNETPERVRIPIPPGALKAGKNVLRIEQTGTKNSPNELDDLGILQIAIQFDQPAGGGASPPRNATQKP